MKPSTDVAFITIVTAILGGIIVLTKISAIIDRIKRILDQIAEYISLRNERKRQELNERRLKQLIWLKLIQSGSAADRLEDLDAAFIESRKRLNRKQKRGK